MTTPTVQTTPKSQRRKVSEPIDWASYNKALVGRGNITLWFSEEAVQAWYSQLEGKPGGQRRYSDLAIETSLTLRLVFKQALRQTEGLIQSLIGLMNIDLQAPDHSTLSRRAKDLNVSMPVKIGKATTIVVDSTGLKVCGQGEWDATKHGQKGRRRWRKLHLCIDEGTLDILSHSLTPQEVGDSTAVPDLLDGVVNTPIDEFLGDGAYDGRPVYDRVENHDAGGQREVVVPPPSNAKLSKNAKTNPTMRDIHVEEHINTNGRCSWENHVNYRRRLTVENAAYRYKTIIGRHMRSRSVTNQKTEVALGCNILNRMAEIGMPQPNFNC